MERSSLVSIHPNEIPTYSVKSDFDVLHVPFNLDIEKLRSNLSFVQNTYPWKTSELRPSYPGIGLQYSDSKNIFSDAVDAYTELGAPAKPFRMFEKINVAGQVFDSIFRRVLPLRLFRSRLLTAKPGLSIDRAFSDGAASMRLHIPIETNPEAWIEVEGRRYHLPADGSGYLVNTSRLHRVGNPGPTPRTHFVGVIHAKYPGTLHPLAQSSFIQLIEGPLGGFKKSFATLTEIAMLRADGRCEACGQNRTLYGMPTPGRQLKAVCAPCIENLGRAIEAKSVHEGTSVHEFESEVERAVISGANL